MPINVVSLSGDPSAPKINGMQSYNSVDQLPASVVNGLAQQFSTGARPAASPVAALRFSAQNPLSR